MQDRGNSKEKAHDNPHPLDLLRANDAFISYLENAIPPRHSNLRLIRSSVVAPSSIEKFGVEIISNSHMKSISFPLLRLKFSLVVVFYDSITASHPAIQFITENLNEFFLIVYY